MLAQDSVMQGVAVNIARQGRVKLAENFSLT